MYEQPSLSVENTAAYSAVAQAIERELGPGGAAAFLRKVQSKGLRVRDFAGVLAKDLLGKDSRAKYAALGNSDQGQIRELYLSKIEKVPADVREKFFKVYAYY